MGHSKVNKNCSNVYIASVFAKYKDASFSDF